MLCIISALDKRSRKLYLCPCKQDTEGSATEDRRATADVHEPEEEIPFGKLKYINYHLNTHQIMAVLFKLFQDNRASSTNKGKYYAHALVTGVKDVSDLSKDIAHSTTVTEADCLAVLKELSNVMNQKLQDGYRIAIPDIGSFKIGLKTKAADTAADFNVAKNVVGYRLNFVPAFRVQGSGKGSKRIYRAFEGIKVEESAFYNVSKKKPQAGSDGQGA